MRAGCVRWSICGFLLAISTHAFITRMAMSVAAQRIQIQFGLSNLEVGWILSSFILGYGVVQLPAGVLTDRVGPHRLLALTLGGWSAFHFLTGMAGWMAWLAQSSITAPLMAIRFVMGIAQAAVLPCAIKTVSRWMPLDERATANGSVMMGLGIGGAVTPPLMVALMSRYDWQFPFYLLGCIGIVLALGWRWYGRDSPEEHQSVGAAELARIGRRAAAESRPSTPWRALFTSRSVWCLALSYGMAGYASYVFFTWFFLYVVNVRKVDIRSGGYWATLPSIAIAVMTPLGGRLSDRLTAKYGKRRGRLTVVLLGATAASLLILIGARVADARMAVVLLALGAGCHLAAQTPSWAASIDLAPSHSATLFGIMNTLAQFTGAAAPVVTPAIAARFGWVRALDFAAAMAALVGVLWIFVQPEKPVSRQPLKRE